MKIDKKTVEYIANLSRLVLLEQEKESFKDQLDKILSYIDKLAELDTSAVQDLPEMFASKNVLRADKKKPSLSQKEVLSNAANKERGFFKVPKIIE